MRGAVWGMTASSNLTSLLNDASRVDYGPPVGDAEALASYKTLRSTTTSAPTRACSRSNTFWAATARRPTGW